MKQITCTPRCIAIAIFILFGMANFTTSAQDRDRETRAAQWDGYKLPAGEFARFVSKKTGVILWHPVEWKESAHASGAWIFRPAPQGVNLFVATEEIPEGIGIAGYASGFLQGVRNQNVKLETATSRRVMLSGLEWREISYDMEADNETLVHQTAWMTASGARAYVFILSMASEELELYEPTFKRIIQSIRIGAAGHWDEEFESLRPSLTAGADADREACVAEAAAVLRTARESLATSVNRFSELFVQSPDAAFELLIDADPLVRIAAITALAKSKLAQTTGALVWALMDDDPFAAAAAASALVTRSAPEVVKEGLARLSEKPSSIVRAGIAFGDASSREWIAELLRGNSAKQWIAGLQLALVTPGLDLPLPYSKLLTSNDLGVLHATIAVLQRHRPVAANELLKLLRSDSEPWAARALGEAAAIETADLLIKRIAEIDARFSALGSLPSKTAPWKTTAGQESKTDGDSEATGILAPSEFESKPELIRLSLSRGELDIAARKIKFRDRWNKATDDSARRAIESEISKEHSDLIDWARSLRVADAIPKVAGSADLGKLNNAATTGETLFPQTTFSYTMAPNLAQTIDRLDAALSGVQMATVRDQMTFALLLKMLKAELASKTDADVTGDVGRGAGVDLRSPIALASWPAFENKDKTHSAALLRVTDSARFERLLAAYQDDFGSLESLFTVTPLLARFAELIPAAVPVAFASLVSDEAGGKIASRVRSSSPRPADPQLKPFIYTRQDRIGDLPVTILTKPTIAESGTVVLEMIYFTYLGETAIVAPSLAAIADLLAQQPSITESDAFAQVRRETSEIVFFSRLNEMMKLLIDYSGTREKSDQLAALVKALGTESGALRMSPASWETVFNVGLADNPFTQSFRPFKTDALAAPRELLPQDTILYAGAMIDPPKMLNALKILETAADKKEIQEDPREKEIDGQIQTMIVPAMQGEIAAALISLKPIFHGGEWPAIAMAVKLKNKDLAEAMRAGKLFPGFKRVANATALGSHIVALGDKDDAPFVAVTDGYLALADSVATLKLLEAKEKFAGVRAFLLSAKEAPENLVIFATYKPEAAFDESSLLINGALSRDMLPLASAIIHAFHSQRAFVTLEKNGLKGHLAVAFDRTGQYAVGDMATLSDNFDLANALIPAKGLTVANSPRVESLTLRLTAKQPGVAPRLRDDLARFSWQRIDSSSDSSVVVTAAARHIPEMLSVPLPITTTALAPFVNATEKINSNDYRIVALAKQIAGDDKDGRSVARKIGEWTHNNLKWKKVESDSIETLASRAADCLEHSELYVALARSLGLPARVVTGAALSGGSFGAHAWVEIYLGKWVELDPTWGLMDHVDATHLRFDGNTFTTYAMLNQLDVEITAARRTVADYQRDPVRLVKEFSLNPATRELAFDLSLTVDDALGADAWDTFDEKQRAAAIAAFEKTVSGMWETWDARVPLDVRVLHSKVSGNRATLTVLRGEILLKFKLASRDGSWFITDHEILDDALPEFADALRGVLQADIRRGRVYELSIEAAEKYIDKLIATEGEKPELEILKYRVLRSKMMQDALERAIAQAEGKQHEIKQTEAAAVDPAIELLKKLSAERPDFAPGQLALARELLSDGNDQSGYQTGPLHKDKGAAVSVLRRYANLVPYDPRPHRELATALDAQELHDEAEAEIRKAIELDCSYLDHHLALVTFLIEHEEPVKAKASFAEMLKASSAPSAAFELLYDEFSLNPDYAKSIEALLLEFPKELSGSKTGLVILASAQDVQNKFADAIKSFQRAIAINPDETEPNDYEYLSLLYRRERRFAEALNAANQAVKLDDKYTSAHFERACSLTQLGRTREAMDAIKRMLEIDPEAIFDTEDSDLQPLATMPEFKVMKEKMKEPTNWEAKPENKEP